MLREARTNVQDVVSAEQDELEQGLLQLIRLYETNPFPLEDLSLYYLNQWLLREGKQAPAWQADPLVTRLPAALEAVQAVRDLPRLRFTTSDFLYLQARLIQRDLARWVVARPVEEPLASWLAKADLNDTTRPQLAAAIQLCDWVVRNIQIEPLPSDEVRGSESWEALAQRGDDGPGYRRYPQETLMVGHGDAYERLHVFIQLCRQVELPAVVIGVAGNASGFRPWAAGVFVGEELYLFDLELGLPLPAADDQGVATLAGLAAHPQWLRQLDLDEKRPYRIAAADLESLEVRVVAMPEELSRRMILLQPALRSQYRMQVALPQDDWNARIAKHKQLSPVVKLWDVPILASLYCELGRNIRLSKDQEFAQLWDLEMSYLDRGQVLEQARRRHLQGIFVPQEQPPDVGAVQFYMQNRPSEFEIDEIRMSKSFRERVGLEKQLPADPAIRQKIIDYQVTKVRRLRESTSFWLGLLQYEQGDYDTAVDWFQKHTLEASPDAYWTRAARYNLARSFEQQGRAEEAAKLYRIDASPQRHGNLIRARRLTSEKTSESTKSNAAEENNAAGADNAAAENNAPTGNNPAADGDAQGTESAETTKSAS